MFFNSVLIQKRLLFRLFLNLRLQSSTKRHQLQTISNGYASSFLGPTLNSLRRPLS